MIGDEDLGMREIRRSRPTNSTPHPSPLVRESLICLILHGRSFRQSTWHKRWRPLNQIFVSILGREDQHNLHKIPQTFVSITLSLDCTSQTGTPPIEKNAEALLILSFEQNQERGFSVLNGWERIKAIPKREKGDDSKSDVIFSHPDSCQNIIIRKLNKLRYMKIKFNLSVKLKRRSDARQGKKHVSVPGALRGRLICRGYLVNSRFSLICPNLSKIGVAGRFSSPPNHTQIHAWLLLDSLSCPLLRFSIGPETSAELHHSKIYGFSEHFGSAGNPLTHPTIYGSSDPQARELSGTPLQKEFHCIR
ncbi:hypothetical protein TNCV_2976851 [Trichonephila clavipes]|nr:hypothetical protein TNCV_2976851 [Trichonephila clavipes]